MTSAGAFDGVRVLDFTQGIAGPYAAMLLAEQGADVIKVETPAGDRARGKPAFHVLNRSKRGIVLDLESADGRRKAQQLAAGADVVIVDSPPEALRRWGIDYEAVSRRNPAGVYCNVPLYGSRGPSANLPPDDDLLGAVSGVFGLQWAHREAPVYLVAPIVSYATGVLAAGATAATLFDRARTGRGDYVEVSGLSGAFALETTSYIVPLAAIDIVRLAGRGDPKGPFPTYRVYRASDGEWFMLACLTPVFWTKLVVALDLVEWLVDPRFAGAPVAIPVVEDRQEISDRLEALFGTQPRQHWLDFLRENDIPVGPVLSRDEFLADPLLVHNRMKAEVDDPEVGKTLQMGVPLTLSETAGAIRGPAPSLGQHSDGVLSEGAAHATGGAPAGTQVDGRAPLEGITVLDLGTIYAGPYAGMLLSDLGANVIKIEPPDGDPWRAFAFGFLGANRGKRGLAVNLKHEEGLALFYDLARKADVVCDNFRAGVRDRLKIDYATLSRINPRIVSCSITPFGSTGPMAGLPGFDPILQARSGLMRAQGGEGQEPVYYQIAVCDFVAALLAVFGVIGALKARERTGRGQAVETSLACAAMAAQAAEFTRYAGRPPDPPGAPDLIGVSALRRAYQCADGWVFLAADTPSAVEALVDVAGDTLGRIDAATLLTAPAEGEVAARLESFFAALPLQEAARRLNAKGVPCAPCPTIVDLFEDEHLKANDLWWETEHTVNGPLRQTGRIVKWGQRSMRLERPAPVLGQHSREALLEMGIEPSRVEELIRKGIVIQTDVPETPIWRLLTEQAPEQTT
jgi:crotonobetainyl-CoA:carnitine CoA-transferase CaiB-like acyl-CoA transferase